MGFDLNGFLILRLSKTSIYSEEIYADMLIEEDSKFMQYCSDTFFSLLNSYYQINRTRYYFNRLVKRYESELVD